MAINHHHINLLTKTLYFYYLPMLGQGSMPDMSTIPAYARGPPGGPPVPMPGHPAPGHPTDSAPPPGQLANTNADLASSRQSFKMAMGNPCK